MGWCRRWLWAAAAAVLLLPLSPSTEATQRGAAPTRCPPKRSNPVSPSPLPVPRQTLTRPGGLSLELALPGWRHLRPTEGRNPACQSFAALSCRLCGAVRVCAPSHRLPPFISLWAASCLAYGRPLPPLRALFLPPANPSCARCDPALSRTRPRSLPRPETPCLRGKARPEEQAGTPRRLASTRPDRLSPPAAAGGLRSLCVFLAQRAAQPTPRRDRPDRLATLLYPSSQPPTIYSQAVRSCSQHFNSPTPGMSA